MALGESLSDAPGHPLVETASTGTRSTLGYDPTIETAPGVRYRVSGAAAGNRLYYRADETGFRGMSAGDDGSGGETGRRPASALLAICGLLAVLLLAGALPAVSTPFAGPGGAGETDAAAVGGGGDDGGPLAEFADEALGDAGVDLGADEETTIHGDAEFTAANEEVYFTVEADRPSYWRTTAYDRYTGDGFERSSDLERTEAVPMEDRREPLEQEISFEVPSSSIPAAWRPVTADPGPGGPQLTYDGANGIEAGDGIDAGETVTVESLPPVTDGEVLASAGTDYPTGIEDRYTALPEDVPDRVGDRTAELTSNAENPYETAVTVERYLRMNYEYELDVPLPEGDVADEMLFEREEAYCAYFAATMTVMLREEGIPARYAVGYNSGEHVGDGEYVVRGMHAHAWVEVYFPGVGWVPFEPTPADDRAEALGEETGEPDGIGGFDAGDRDAEPEHPEPPAEDEEPLEEDDELPEDDEPPEDDEEGDGELPEEGDGEPPDDEPVDTSPNADEETAIHGNAEFVAADETRYFTVEADRPSYWRRTAYDHYTGNGWERTAGHEPDPNVPMVDERDTLSQEVTVETTASPVVPGAWRAMEVQTGPGGPDVELDEEWGYQVDGTLEPGETATVESVLPVTDGEVLASAGTGYPDGIEQRYTALPDDVPDRVGERTGEITAEAENPYETAVAVESYLRSNYEYELDVPPPEGDIADEMLFEREEAYCAYFATTMTVMLREEGVPARYVTGYGAGEYLGDGEYAVRGMHAHAWVEVYFPGVGWVPFEPTPADDRAETLEEETDIPDDIGGADPGDRDGEPDVPEDDEADETGDGDADETGDEADEADEPGDEGDETGETGDGDADEHEADEADETGDEGDEADEADDEDADEDEADDGTDDELPPLELALEDDPVPGEELTVTVSREDEPQSDLWVTFNGESVGETDAEGQVTGTVPYAESLEIAVHGSPPAGGAASLGDHFARPTGVASVENETRSVELPTAIDVEVDGDRVPGGDVTVNATVQGTPVPGAEVSVDGETVAETDADGEAELALPEASEATIAVERDSVAGETVLELPTTIELELDGDPYPGGELAVTATFDGEPVDGATVELDGETVAETDADGEAELALPDAENATVSVERGALYGEETVELAETSVSIDASPVALPFAGATVDVTADEEPVADAPVAVDGAVAAETDANGTAAVTLPAALSTTVEAGEDGTLGSTTARPLTNALLGAAALGIVGAISARNARGRVAGPARRLASLPGVVCRRALTAIVRASRRLDTLLTAALAGLRRALSGVEGAVETLRGLVRRLRAAALGALGTLRALPGLFSLATLREFLDRSRGETVAGDGERSSATPLADEGVEAPEPTVAEVVREAWNRLLAAVGLRRPETRTPAEIAERAVDAGLPPDAVETVLDAFRRLEYGERPPDSAEGVDRAAERLTEEGEP